MYFITIVKFTNNIEFLYLHCCNKNINNCYLCKIEYVSTHHFNYFEIGKGYEVLRKYFKGVCQRKSLNTTALEKRKLVVSQQKIRRCLT